MDKEEMTREQASELLRKALPKPLTPREIYEEERKVVEKPLKQSTVESAGASGVVPGETVKREGLQDFLDREGYTIEKGISKGKFKDKDPGGDVYDPELGKQAALSETSKLVPTQPTVSGAMEENYKDLEGNRHDPTEERDFDDRIKVAREAWEKLFPNKEIPYDLTSDNRELEFELEMLEGEIQDKLDRDEREYRADPEGIKSEKVNQGLREWFDLWVNYPEDKDIQVRFYYGRKGDWRISIKAGEDGRVVSVPVWAWFKKLKIEKERGGWQVGDMKIRENTGQEVLKWFMKSVEIDGRKRPDMEVVVDDKKTSREIGFIKRAKRKMERKLSEGIEFKVDLTRIRRAEMRDKLTAMFDLWKNQGISDEKMTLKFFVLGRLRIALNTDRGSVVVPAWAFFKALNVREENKGWSPQGVRVGIEEIKSNSKRIAESVKNWIIEGVKRPGIKVEFDAEDKSKRSSGVVQKGVGETREKKGDKGWDFEADVKRLPDRTLMDKKVRARVENLLDWWKEGELSVELMIGEGGQLWGRFTSKNGSTEIPFASLFKALGVSTLHGEYGSYWQLNGKPVDSTSPLSDWESVLKKMSVGGVGLGWLVIADERRA